MVEKITVIGAGSTGHAVASYLSQRGVQVTFHDDERWAQRFEDIRELGGITLRGGAHGTGMPVKMTTDPAEAVRGAEFIFVNVMSDRQEEIARRIAPFVEDGQHILIIPGNLGSFVFRRVFDEMGVTAKVTLSEKEGNFCACRLSGKAEVTTGYAIRSNGKIASLPASDTQKVIDALKGLLDYSANKNVFEGTIHAGNVINHIACTILSAAEIEHKGDAYALFQYSLTPSVVKCIGKIREERRAVIEALGWTERPNPMGTIEKMTHMDEHPEARNFYTYMTGPNSLDHRYLHEDCSCGAALAISFAKRLGLEMPVLEAFWGVAGAINDRDYIGGGRTLENLGFGPELTVDEIFAMV